ncbi:MAG: hypothetical protein LBV58_01150 [Acholeplasmatales bacterium]|jgi:hypothetical protein|nr:hypothetical protein [Acholeplasmatales bacterium]
MSYTSNLKNEYSGSKTFKYNTDFLRVDWTGFDLSIYKITDPINPLEIRESKNVFLDHIESDSNSASVQEFVKKTKGIVYISDVTIPDDSPNGVVWVTFRTNIVGDVAKAEADAGQPVKWTRYPVKQVESAVISVQFTSYFTV